MSLRSVYKIGLVLLPIVGCCFIAPFGAAATAESNVKAKVSLHSTGATLKEILKQLSEKTDWKYETDRSLAELRLTAEINDQPLSDCVDQLAKLISLPPLHCTVTRDPQTHTFYFRDAPGTRKHLVSLVEKRNADFRRRLREALSIGTLDAAQQEKYRATHPAQLIDASTYRPMYRLAASFDFDQVAGLTRSGELRLPFRELNQTQKQIVFEQLKNTTYVSGIIKPDGTRGEEQYVGARDYKSSELEVSIYGRPSEPGAGAWIWTTKTSRRGCPDLLHRPVPPPGERPEWLRAALQAQDEKRSGKQPITRRTPPDEALKRRVTVRARFKGAPSGPTSNAPLPCTLSPALKQVSLQTGLPLIADYDPGSVDYYHNTFMVRYLPQDLVDMPLHDVLDRFTEIWGIEWEKSGNWLLVRSREAPFARVGEVRFWAKNPELEVEVN